MTQPNRTRRTRISALSPEFILVTAALAVLVLYGALFVTTAPRGLDDDKPVPLQPGTQLVVGRATLFGFAHDPVAIFSTDGKLTIGIQRRVNLDKSVSLMDSKGEELFRLTWPDGPEKPAWVETHTRLTGLEPTP